MTPVGQSQISREKKPKMRNQGCKSGGWSSPGLLASPPKMWYRPAAGQKLRQIKLLKWELFCLMAIEKFGKKACLLEVIGGWFTSPTLKGSEGAPFLHSPLSVWFMDTVLQALPQNAPYIPPENISPGECRLSPQHQDEYAMILGKSLLQKSWGWAQIVTGQGKRMQLKKNGVAGEEFWGRGKWRKNSRWKRKWSNHLFQQNSAGKKIVRLFHLWEAFCWPIFWWEAILG